MSVIDNTTYAAEVSKLGVTGVQENNLRGMYTSSERDYLNLFVAQRFRNPECCHDEMDKKLGSTKG